MQTKIDHLVRGISDKTIARRRDFHQYAETAWTEFRTASIVADTLTNLGYEVLAGEEVLDSNAMMGVPAEEELVRHAQRALSQGANPVWVQKMQGGKTGVVGVMTFINPGPTVTLRFDMDANDGVEAMDKRHRPYKEGFASINQGAAHACGHDGHIAIGLSVAEILAGLKNELGGKVKLIFQPAEEGARGAKPMAAKGIADNSDYLLGMHLGLKLVKTGQFAGNVNGFLATSKCDAIFTGVPAHAGVSPEAGRNALLAAATAVLNLHAISRHSRGLSRINVGQMHAGTGWNVIPASAVIKFETRGTTNEINEYMVTEAQRMIEGAALMHGVKVNISEMGGAASCSNSPGLVTVIEQVARRLGIFREIMQSCDFGASEDCTYFMDRVQQSGGQAAYIVVGADLAAGHHDCYFDFDEKSLDLSVVLLSNLAVELLLKHVWGSMRNPPNFLTM